MQRFFDGMNYIDEISCEYQYFLFENEIIEEDEDKQ